MSWLRPAGICAALLVFGGCVNLSKSYPEKHSYALEAARQAEAHASVPGTVLKVRKFRASPAFEGKELVYRTSDTRYEADFYSEWFVPPNAMLTQQVVNQLTAAGPFQYVTDGSGLLPPTHVLDGTVTVLYGDYRTTPAKAVLGLQVFFIDQAASPPAIVFQREYHKEVEVGDRSPDALVQGWNVALRSICDGLVDDLNKGLLHP